MKISATARPAEVQELEAEVRQLKREQDYATSRKRFDRAKEIQADHEARSKALEEATDRWRRERGSGSAEVRVEHVAQVVSKLTGIPVTELTTEERERLTKLEERMHERVVGPGGGGQGGERRRAPRPRRAARGAAAGGDLPVPRPDRRGQDRAGQGAGGGGVRRRGRDDPPRHERVHGAPHGRPADRRAAGLRGLRGGRAAHRAGAAAALLRGAARRDREGAPGRPQHPAAGLR